MSRKKRDVSNDSGNGLTWLFPNQEGVMTQQQHKEKERERERVCVCVCVCVCASLLPLSPSSPRSAT